MLYSLSTTPSANVTWCATNLPTLIGATILYQGTSDVVFSTTRIPSKVIRFNFYNSLNLFACTIGDAWTSGVTITNPIAITSLAPNSISNLTCVVTPDVFGMTSYCSGWDIALFTTLGNADNYAIGVGSGNVTGTSYNITRGTTSIVTTLYKPMSASTGYYYSTDMYATEGGTLTSSIQGVKSLLNPTMSTSGPNYTTSGNDAIVPGGVSNGSTIQGNIVIVNGYI